MPALLPPDPHVVLTGVDTQTREVAMHLTMGATTAVVEFIEERDYLRDEVARLKRMVEYGFRDPAPPQLVEAVRELQWQVRRACPTCAMDLPLREAVRDHVCPLTAIERALLGSKAY